MAGLEVNNGLFKNALKDYIESAKNGFKEERLNLGTDIGETASQVLGKKVEKGSIVEINYKEVRNGKSKDKTIKVSGEMNGIIAQLKKTIKDEGFLNEQIPSDHWMLWRNKKTTFIETTLLSESQKEGDKIIGPLKKENMTLTIDKKNPLSITLHYSHYIDPIAHFSIIKEPNGNIEITQSNEVEGFKINASNDTKNEVIKYLKNKYGDTNVPQNLDLLFPGYA